MRRKKRDACPPIDAARLLLDMQSPDEVVRGKAVREFCPCHAGWEMFERHVGVVSRLTRDRSRAVRAHALHVFRDAAKMQQAGEWEYWLQALEELAGKKRASRFRPDEAEAEARRGVRAVRRRRGRQVVR